MDDILFIAAHPDDETLGCGGTILKHAAGGDRIHWMVVTGVHIDAGWTKEIVERREKEIEAVTSAYRFDSVHMLDFPTIRLDTVPMSDLTSAISSVIREVSPSTVYLPNGSDIHTDHQIVFKASMSCTKNFRFPFIRRILMYECLSETEFSPPSVEDMFNPNVFIDISEFLEKKIDIMKLYELELMDPPLPRSPESLRHLAGYRGSRIGKDYAEAFVLLGEIL